MSITVDAELRRPTQEEFAAIAYETMEAIFAVRNELGRFLREEVYHRAIERRLLGARSKVAIRVAFEGFCHHYFIDLLVHGAALFELKAVERLTRRHQAQLINYLLLADLPHGKLVNLRPELVKHDFVNARLRLAERTEFQTDERRWRPIDGTAGLRPWLTAALHDWGTGLDVELYEAACTHFFGGADSVIGQVEVVLDGRSIGNQPVRLATPAVAFKITALPQESCTQFESHAQRLLAHTSLTAIQWININLKEVSFTTLQKQC